MAGMRAGQIGLEDMHARVSALRDEIGAPSTTPMIVADASDPASLDGREFGGAPLRPDHAPHRPGLSRPNGSVRAASARTASVPWSTRY